LTLSAFRVGLGTCAIGGWMWADRFIVALAVACRRGG